MQKILYSLICLMILSCQKTAKETPSVSSGSNQRSQPKEALNSELPTKASSKPWLGVLFARTEAGWLVERVYPGSGAVDAGVTFGDTLLSINDIPLNSQFKKLPGAIGDTIIIVAVHKSKLKKYHVVLRAFPAYLKNSNINLQGLSMSLQGQLYANAKAYKDSAKLTIVDFWATWCGPCKITAPILNNIYHKFSNQGIQVVGLSKEAIPLLSDYQTKHPVDYPLMHDLGGKSSTRLGIQSIPTLVILDQDGFILKVEKGVPHEQELHTWITNYLLAQ